MRKNSWISVCLPGIIFSSTVVNADPSKNFYVEGGVGTARLEASKTAPGSPYLDHNGNTTVGRIAVGSLFWDHIVGLETGYSRFAEVKSPFSDGGITGQTKSRRDAIDVLGVIKYPFDKAKTILGYAAIGGAYAKAHSKVVPASSTLLIKNNDWVPTIALGLEYVVDKHLGISATYRHWGRHHHHGNFYYKDATHAFMLNVVFRNELL